MSTSKDSPKSCNEGAAIVLYADDDPTDFQPPSKPGKPHASKVTESEISLVWTKPKYGFANVTSYTAQYRPSKNPPEQWMTQQTSGESLTVENLVPGTEYQFKVLAECKAGVSPTSEVSDGIKTKGSTFNSEQEGKRTTAGAIANTLTCSTSTHSAHPNSTGAMTQQGPTEHFPPNSSHNQLQGMARRDLSGVSPIKLQLPPSGMLPPVSAPIGPQFLPSTVTPQVSGPMELQFPRSTMTPQLFPADGPTNLQFPLSAMTSWLPVTSTSERNQLPSLTSVHKPLLLLPAADPSFVPSDRPLNREQLRNEPQSNDASFSAVNDHAAQNAGQTDSFQETHNNDKTPILHVFDQGSTSESPFGSLEKPKVSKITYNRINLEWKKLTCGRNVVEYYSVDYHVYQDPDGVHKIRKTNGVEERITIDGLSPETCYVFKLQANFASGINIESKPTGPVQTKSHLAEKVRLNSKLFSKKTATQPAIYELNKKQMMVNKKNKVAKYEIGKPIARVNEKVLMVVGATGAGKTTLINGIANYMYGVQWDDDYRFVLVSNEPSRKSQAHSQTSWITAYTLHWKEGSPIPYSLTIIDTPGFGDTEGIERDKKIADQIKDFFSIRPPNGVDVLHGIGFVAQASLARLSHSQKYIFDSILSIYGRDVASNIFLMATFADGQPPPVLEAINEAEIPHQSCFKFNNSALFVSGEEGSFDGMFWQMGMKSFINFFQAFGVAEHKSLQLTREVLDERKQLENVLKELQPQIHSGLTKMDELQRVVMMLQHNKDVIEQNKDFYYSVPVTKQRKLDTPPGQYTTNCLNCNYTCHESCAFANNEDKRSCCAMDAHGDCTVCPGNCTWSKHVNNPYIFELYEEEEVRTSAELKDRYDTAKQGESRAETMISNIKDELNTLECLVLEMVDKARKSLMRLDEIALKPNPLSEVDYIDQLIVSEEQQCRLGWTDRVKAYKVLRKRAALMRKIKTHQPVVNEPLFSWLGEGASRSYTTETLDHLRRPQKQNSKSWYQFWKS